MNPDDQKVKVETDYKISRHFNGIVFSVIALMILLVLIYLFVFLKGRHKVMPSGSKPTASAARESVPRIHEESNQPIRIGSTSTPESLP